MFHIARWKCLLPLLSLVILWSCGSSDEKVESDPAFAEFISAHTAGIVSSNSSIKVVFSQSPLKPGEPGAIIDSEVFKFDPSIKGHAEWENEFTVVFVPDEKLSRETRFVATLNLGAFFKVESNMRDFKFEFQTAKQAFSYLTHGMTSLSKTDLKWNQLFGKLLAADPVTLEELEKTILLEDGNSNIPLRWAMDEQGTGIEFFVDSLERKTTARNLQLRIEDRDTIAIRIPGLNEFEVMNLSLNTVGNGVITVAFSDPISEKQDFSGMFRIGSENVNRVEVDNNMVYLYPARKYAGSHVVYVSAGIKNIMGFGLPNGYNQSLLFEAQKPEVKFVGKGVISPLSGNLVMPFEAVGLNAVDVVVYKIFNDNVTQFLQVNDRLSGSYQLKRVGRPIAIKKIDLIGQGVTDLGNWNTFALKLDEIIKPDPGALYRVQLRFRREYSNYPCEALSGDAQVQSFDADFDEPEDEYYDEYDEYDYYYEDYDWRERDNPCHNSYYGSQRFQEKNIFATDLALIVKKTQDDKYIVYVNDLVTAKPKAGVEVQLLNYQKQSIVSGSTNDAGKVELTTGKKVFLIAAKSGNQRAYLRMDNGHALDLGTFDVSGEGVRDGVRGFIYGERGVWRPGDTIFTHFIYSDLKGTIPEGHPIEVQLFDPNGKVVQKLMRNTGKSEIIPIHLLTRKDAPTGNYNLVVSLGNANFYKSLRVETVKPNRLKIVVKAKEDYIGPESSIQIHSEWLTGLKVSGLRTTLEGTIYRGGGFEKFKEYNFMDPSKEIPYMEKEIFDGPLDQNGNTSVEMKLNNLQYAPGPLKISLFTKVFEEGGDFSVDQVEMPLMPFSHFVGVKFPDPGKYNWLETGKKHRIDIVRVNNAGNPDGKGKVRVKIYKVDYSWWWDYNRGNSSYLGGSHSQLVDNLELNLTGGKANFNFEKSNQMWGRYYVQVLDENGKHSTGGMIYLDWPYGMDRSNRAEASEATLLRFSGDKDKYEVGDVASISIPSSIGGRVLLSIENGTGQMKDIWKDAGNGITKFEIPITADMAPTVYAWIHYIQPHSKTINDLPIRMYGVIPIHVNNAASHLTPVIKAPKSIRPKTDYQIDVSEAAGKEMNYTLFVVDEGLLSLTRFKTPDPWSAFYAREALGVRTWDFYDEVIGAFGGKIDGLLAIGGDAALLNGSKKKAQRFIPVVSVIGPFNLKAGATAKHVLKMPNYVGNVRVMVVAAKGKAYGHAETNVPVKQPLMTLATVPRVLGPSEELTIPVTVFAMEKSVKNVQVKLNVSGPVTLMESSKQITFSEIGEQTVFFKMKAKPTEGIVKVNVEVSSGAESASSSTEFDVRGAVAPFSKVTDNLLEPGGSVEIPVNAFGIDGANALTLEVSALPDLGLTRLFEYLDAYPHMCSEQLTSTAFPLLFADDLIERSAEVKSKNINTIREVMSNLRIRQLPNGGIRLWPGNDNAHPWVTSYAGDFMLEAEKKGFDLPIGLKNQWIKYQQNTARSWTGSSTSDYYSTNDLVQAYRLYTLAKAGKAELGAMNRLRRMNTISMAARWRLAAAYAIIGQNDAAKELIGRSTTDFKAIQGDITFGSPLRDRAMVIETLLLMNDKTRARKVFMEMIQNLKMGNYTSQSTSFALLACSKMMGADKKSDMKLEYELGAQKGTIQTANLVKTQRLKPTKNGVIKVKNTSAKSIFVRVVETGRPLESMEPVKQNNIALSVEYKDGSGNRIDPTKLTQGTQFKAIVTVSRGLYLDSYKDIALTQIFPSGWEIINRRLFGDQSASGLDYQDIRDDRMMSYFNLLSKSAVTIEVDLVATYTGRFYLPPVLVEAMYDPSINALTEGKWVEVLKP